MLGWAMNGMVSVQRRKGRFGRAGVAAAVHTEGSANHSSWTDTRPVR